MTEVMRVTPTSTSRLSADEPIDIDTPTSAVEPWGPGRAVVHGTRDAWALIGADRPAASGRPRVVEVVVDGWRFELEVEPARLADLRARATRERSTAASGGPLEIRAMIPGRVASVAISVGDPVSAGQTLLVVEAMKMQNDLRSPHAGVVERVAVGAGDTIELGQLLAILAVGS